MDKDASFLQGCSGEVGQSTPPMRWAELKKAATSMLSGIVGPFRPTTAVDDERRTVLRGGAAAAAMMLLDPRAILSGEQLFGQPKIITLPGATEMTPEEFDTVLGSTAVGRIAGNVFNQENALVIVGPNGKVVLDLRDQEGVQLTVPDGIVDQLFGYGEDALSGATVDKATITQFIPLRGGLFFMRIHGRISQRIFPFQPNPCPYCVERTFSFLGQISDDGQVDIRPLHRNFYETNTTKRFYWSVTVMQGRTYALRWINPTQIEVWELPEELTGDVHLKETLDLGGNRGEFMELLPNSNDSVLAIFGRAFYGQPMLTVVKPNGYELCSILVEGTTKIDESLFIVDTAPTSIPGQHVPVVLLSLQELDRDKGHVPVGPTKSLHILLPKKHWLNWKYEAHEIGHQIPITNVTGAHLTAPFDEVSGFTASSEHQLAFEVTKNGVQYLVTVKYNKRGEVVDTRAIQLQK